MLFVTAARQRKANFGNRLLKNISALNSAINHTGDADSPVRWASLWAALVSSSPAPSCGAEQALRGTLTTHLPRLQRAGEAA